MKTMRAETLNLRASDYDFDLPEDRIAHAPARPRDAARLLEVTGAQLADHIIRDLPSLLRPGDLLVANDTSVIPAHLSAMRGAARIGITLDRPAADGSWHALARNARRLRIGDRLAFADDALGATITALDEAGAIRLRFDQEGEAFDAALRRVGALALPPYIARPAGPTEADQADYQTMFAAHDGAVAAPTAGLHFTPDLLAALAERGVGHATVTLHVGAGTFLPMRDDDVSAHRIHAERGSIDAQTVETILRTRAQGGRVVAVGTTTLRLLESAAADGTLRAFAGETSLFILPGHRFHVADLLITNFHLPRSTLFMLTCAFAGEGAMRAAYAHAIAAKYRFYSYGDACLLHRDAAS